jgi:hypothetical protein
MSLPGSSSPLFVELVAAGWIRRREYDIAPVNVFGGAPPPAPAMNRAGGLGGGGGDHHGAVPGLGRLI